MCWASAIGAGDPRSAECLFGRLIDLTGYALLLHRASKGLSSRSVYSFSVCCRFCKRKDGVFLEMSSGRSLGKFGNYIVYLIDLSASRKCDFNVPVYFVYRFNQPGEDNIRRKKGLRCRTPNLFSIIPHISNITFK